ncbi:hypothetical protein HNY73_012581 [Argiope bruennichi]|uniref:Uncharacterized protein n=1 Tax=Argiope bruennichi TaxID=94029 RepID=A0A8T0F053_ARGBR|nr:hypothetical protein HNY73_012581 [Argiope bruennichi]
MDVLFLIGSNLRLVILTRVSSQSSLGLEPQELLPTIRVEILGLDLMPSSKAAGRDIWHHRHMLGYDVTGYSWILGSVLVSLYKEPTEIIHLESMQWH